MNKFSPRSHSPVQCPRGYRGFADSNWRRGAFVCVFTRPSTHFVHQGRLSFFETCPHTPLRPRGPPAPPARTRRTRKTSSCTPQLYIIKINFLPKKIKFELIRADFQGWTRPRGGAWTIVGNSATAWMSSKKVPTRVKRKRCEISSFLFQTISFPPSIA